MNNDKLKEILVYLLEVAIERNRSILHHTPIDSEETLFRIRILEKGEAYLQELKESKLQEKELQCEK